MRKLLAIIMFAGIICVGSVISAFAFKLPASQEFVMLKLMPPAPVPGEVAFDRPETPASNHLEYMVSTEGPVIMPEIHCNSPGHFGHLFIL